MRVSRSTSSSNARAGLTIVETAISMAVYAVFVGALTLTLRGLSRNAESIDASQELAREGLRAVGQMRLDLQRSGWAEIDGLQWPFTEEAGIALDDWPALNHEVPHQHAGDPASRPIFLRLPADANGDGWPDLSAAGGVSWSDEAVAWLIVPAEDGTNTLVRRSSSGAEGVFGSNVNWIVFETPSETGYQIPLNSIRVRLEFQEEGADGVPMTMELEEVVRLWNGGYQQ